MEYGNDSVCPLVLAMSPPCLLHFWGKPGSSSISSGRTVNHGALAPPTLPRAVGDTADHRFGLEWTGSQAEAKRLFTDFLSSEIIFVGSLTMMKINTEREAEPANIM